MKRPKIRALPIVSGVLVLGLGGVVGWLSIQEPLPDSLPYQVNLPYTEPSVAVVADEPAETRPDGDTSITMTEEPEPVPEPEPVVDTAAVEETEVETVDAAATDEPATGPAAEATVSIAADTSSEEASTPQRALRMQPIPHPDLIEKGRYGLMPVISADGAESWQIYARPYDDTDPRPQVALVIGDLGLNRAQTHQALQLPGSVTLAFSPYADGLQEWVRQARAAGHEVLLEMPMEPPNYPADDPGPRALLTSLGPTQNLDRLDWLLSRFQGYVGVIENMGGRFSTSPLHIEPVLTVLKRRGLMYISRRRNLDSLSREIATDIDLLSVGIDIEVDIDPSTREIDQRLSATENRARRTGAAIAGARPYPATFEAVRAWMEELESRDAVLAPLTAVIARLETG
ncbi:MAG: divergent polysaccharide deacetylase family protein [Alphaproteobacteria bacterium]